MVRFDRDWPDSGNGIAIQEIAADYAAIDLRNDVEESFVLDHVAEQARGDFRIGKIRNEIVCLRNFLKCAIANRTDRSSIGLAAPSQSDQFGLPSSHCTDHHIIKREFRLIPGFRGFLVLA